jgi:cobalamin-dependent methionine synthase I
VSEQVEALVEKAITLYERLALPKGVMAEISLADFQEVFTGEGKNTLPAPLPGIVERADGLALFAATVGDSVSERIQELFQENDPATACMLDGIASDRAETAATLMAETFLESLLQEEEVSSDARALPYSPGYCGWHITGQRKLFAFLKPEQIGITLNNSCLMSPIKSVSGVLVAGAPQIHDFANDFDFCFDCTSWECRTRIASLAQVSPTKR